MAEITFNNSAIEISAAIIADGLALAPNEVPALMRVGERERMPMLGAPGLRFFTRPSASASSSRMGA